MPGTSELRDLTGYDEDFLLWSEEQAELLRRRAAARPEAFAGLDIANLIEEVGDLGKTDLRTAGSFIVQIFIHLIKIASEPESPSVGHWLREVTVFQDGLGRAWAPSMRQRIVLEKEWRTAVKAVRRELSHLGKAIRLSERCPFTFDELLSESFDPHDAARRLADLPAV